MHYATDIGGRLRLMRVFIAVLLSACWLLSAYSVNAVNMDYLQEIKWRDNSNVIWEDVNASATGKTLNGSFGRFVDDERCLYTYFAVSGDLLENNRDFVKIAFHVVTDSCEYDFGADVNGICDTPSDEASRMFDVRTNFEGRDHGVYICAVQYLGAEATCRFDVSFYSGRVISVMSDIAADLPEETVPAATAKTTTKKEAKTTGQTAAKTTTAKNSAAKSSAAGKTATTAKYQPQGGYTAKAAADVGGSVDGDVPESAAATESLASRAVMTKDAVILLLIGIALLLSGGIILAVYFFNSKRTPPSAPDNGPPQEDKTDDNQA